MKITTKKNIEAVVHVLFWIFIFSAINVDWTSDWFDKTIRPRTPAPLSVLVFPIIFYTHSLWAIPKFLNREKWKIYLLAFVLIFIFPELVRSGLLALNGTEITFWEELRSRDSLVLGEPNVLWMAFTFSVAYRFTKDWFVKQHQIEHLGKQLSEHLKRKLPITQPLNKNESSTLNLKLEDALRKNHIYLNQDLSLAELAKQIDTSDKKLSTLLNQNLQTNFYDYINTFRIAAFKKGVSEGKLEHLSIVGLAHQCGFKSKSSFYRAFKKETGMSPSQFIQ
jgi:AraC-like DNA-binding protein